MMQEIDEILRRLADQIEQPMEPLETPTVSGEGASEDELVRVTMTGGEVSSIRIDPRAMRKSGVELADDLRTATNAAIGAHNEAMFEAMSDSAPNPGEISQGIESIREEASQSLTDYLDLITNMTERNAGRME